MPPDPKRLADTRAWLAKVATDLRAATVDLNAEPPILSDAVFHCQQTVEKTLKAFLAWHDRPFRKTHNLVELGGQCAEIDSSLEPLLRRAAPLTEYASEYRYPGELEEPTSEEAEQTLSIAREVHEAVLARLPTDVRP